MSVDRSAMLLAGFGSPAPDPDTTARFTMVVPTLVGATRTMSRLAVVPLVIVPSAQVALPESSRAQHGSVPMTAARLEPAGSWSVTWTAWAVSGPRLVTAIV